METKQLSNPYRAGSGHAPPYLAGRERQLEEFRNLLQMGSQAQNLILTGLHGVGKTALTHAMKPLALEVNWLWSYTDFSLSANITEEGLAERIITSFAMFCADIPMKAEDVNYFGLVPPKANQACLLNFDHLFSIYDKAPGLIADKLKTVLELVWKYIEPKDVKGVALVYDEAQNLSEQAADYQQPLTALIDVFQPIQEKGIPFMLVLSGLPTLFPKLVSTRRVADSMFRVIHVENLDEKERREAIIKPIEDHSSIVQWGENTIQAISELSMGHPFFIQLICREIYDISLNPFYADKESVLSKGIPSKEIIQKLNVDFFADLWSNATSRQQDVLMVVATLERCEEEFSVQEVADKSKDMLDKPLSSSQVNQLLMKLSQMGLVYKSRYGRYSFAVQLLTQFIKGHSPILERVEEVSVNV